MPSVDTKFYGLSQVMDYHRFNPLCVIRVGGLKMLWVTVKPDNLYPWWTPNSMGYHRLWVITVWIISGLTVQSTSVYSPPFWHNANFEKVRIIDRGKSLCSTM